MACHTDVHACREASDRLRSFQQTRTPKRRSLWVIRARKAITAPSGRAGFRSRSSRHCARIAALNARTKNSSGCYQSGAASEWDGPRRTTACRSSVDHGRRGESTSRAAIESLNGGFCDECLNAQWSTGLSTRQPIKETGLRQPSHLPNSQGLEQKAKACAGIAVELGHS